MQTLDVQHLPLEHPATYKRVRDLLVGALVPALEAALGPLWAGLPKGSSNRQRRDALTALLMQHREGLQCAVFEHLQPIKVKAEGETRNTLELDTRGHTQQRDGADTTWELVVWSLHALLQHTFEGRKVCTVESQGTIIMRGANIWLQKKLLDPQGKPVWMVGVGDSAVPLTEIPEGSRIVPFFLDQLARKLACVELWQASHAARCLQGVFSELSAEHTLERLQWYYGQGGDFSVNRITQVLRPVDTHQNRALGVLTNPKDLEKAVVLVLGTAYSDESFRVRQVTQRRLPMPVHWLMNWTDAFKTIQDILALALTTLSQAKTSKFGLLRQAADDAQSDDLDRLTQLSSNKDVYIRNKQGELVWDTTLAKIGGALQQLFDLHQMGSAGTRFVDLGELLDRLSEEGLEDGSQEEGEAEQESGAATGVASHPLGAVFDCLEAEPNHLVRVAVLLRLCARLPDKAARLELYEDLVLCWAEQGVFDRLGIQPGVAALTEQRLALACGLPLTVFRQRVEASLSQFDTLAALAGEAAEHATGALLKVPHPILRVGVALRLLKRLPSPGEREQRARALWKAWSDPDRFDRGLFEFLGVCLLGTKAPEDTDQPWAEKALLGVLTDELMARTMKIDEDSFRTQVEQAVAQFDSDHPTNPRSRSKAGSAKAGAKQ